MNIPPSVIAAGIAGAGIGTTSGIMIKGEQLEKSGVSDFQGVTGTIGGGIVSGIKGAGMGVGISGTAVALKRILGK
jgi:hypothetical protein